MKTISRKVIFAKRKQAVFYEIYGTYNLLYYLSTIQ